MSSSPVAGGASASAVAVWRLALLIGAPLAFAVTGTLHLVPASGPTVGTDFDHVVPHRAFGQAFMSYSW
jgi:hypothetical protein